MLESGLSGSVRGVLSNGHPYRDPGSIAVIVAKANNRGALFDHLVGGNEEGDR